MPRSVVALSAPLCGLPELCFLLPARPKRMMLFGYDLGVSRCSFAITVLGTLSSCCRACASAASIWWWRMSTVGARSLQMADHSCVLSRSRAAIGRRTMAGSGAGGRCESRCPMPLVWQYLFREAVSRASCVLAVPSARVLRISCIAMCLRVVARMGSLVVVFSFAQPEDGRRDAVLRLGAAERVQRRDGNDRLLHAGYCSVNRFR